MRNYLAVLATLMVAAAAMATSAFGGQPDNPGCFGQDRAAWLAANGGAAWGAIAPERGGDNGAINQAYMNACGGDPAP